ncbi:MAG: hypothetical protein RL689_2005 [Planctomycetota bacterium]|jgi:hypothetical protein
MRPAQIIRVLIVVALGVASVFVVLSKRPRALEAGDPLTIRNTSGSELVAVVQSPAGQTERLTVAAGGSAQGRFDPGMTIHVFVGEAKGMSMGSWTISAIGGPLDIEVGGEDLSVSIAANGLASQDAELLHINAP